MKQIKLFFIAVALMVSALASAQNITVTGVVKDSSNGEGIPFASLQLKGTMIGTSTDIDGFYSIEVPADFACKPLRLSLAFGGNRGGNDRGRNREKCRRNREFIVKRHWRYHSGVAYR